VETKPRKSVIVSTLLKAPQWHLASWSIT